MKGKLLAFGVSLLAMATIGVVQLQSKAVDGNRDCDQYAIIHCGAMNRDELIKEYASNGTSNENGYTTAQDDIKKIFTAMGISRADLDSRVEQGVVYKDGTIKVGDKVVATGAMMAARGLGGTQIPGTNAQKVSVSAMSDAQTAMVFYKNGKFAFAVMKPCANPVSATPKEEPTPPKPEPTAECVGVTATMQERTKYSITATAKADNGAKIKSYTFTATKDGKTVFNNTYDSDKTSQSVVYQNLTAGEYNVKVVVNTSEGEKSGPNCKTTFTVAPEPVTPTPGIDVQKIVTVDPASPKYARVNADVQYSYKITVTNTGNTNLEGVTVTDTPDKAITLIRIEPPLATIENNSFVIRGMNLLKGESRTFVVYAKVPVAVAGRLANTVCVDAPTVPGNPDKCDKAEVEVPPTPVPGKARVCDASTKTIIEVPVDQKDKYEPENSEKCKETTTVTPPELPETGPVETTLSVIGAMSLVGASAYYVASRRQA